MLAFVVNAFFSFVFETSLDQWYHFWYILLCIADEQNYQVENIVQPFWVILFFILYLNKTETDLFTKRIM